jgi:ArsR family transcriptional regulator
MQLAVLFAQSLADETRWRVLLLLWEQPLCVCELADILAMPQSSVSSHVQVIRRAGLLERERREKWVYYRVARTFLPLLAALREHFDLYPATLALLARDQKRMQKRLAERERSCCPSPKALAFKASRSAHQPAHASIRPSP